ncbi:MAG: hypothetical protein Q8P05_00925 [Candidatus Diapherotrites archaeon]|nr:hypothetical protein [Candidatus Diapherotrites archaeon]MDZ4256699.1 hypothetical protein [archaeon]
MRADITHKIPQGKMVRLTLEYDTTILHSAQICGDFFVHPEETIAAMEQALVKIPVESTRERVQHILDGVVERHHAQLIGVDTPTLSQLICEAINQ